MQRSKIADLFLRKQDKKQRFTQQNTYDQSYIKCDLLWDQQTLSIIKIHAILIKGQHAGQPIPLQCKWYLKTKTDFKQIQGINTHFYQPCVYDIGGIICVHIEPKVPNRVYKGVTIIKQTVVIQSPQILKNNFNQMSNNKQQIVFKCRVQGIFSNDSKFQFIQTPLESEMIIKSKKEQKAISFIRISNKQQVCKYQINNNYPTIQIIRKTNVCILLNLNANDTMKLMFMDNLKRDLFLCIIAKIIGNNNQLLKKIGIQDQLQKLQENNKQLQKIEQQQESRRDSIDLNGQEVRKQSIDLMNFQDNCIQIKKQQSKQSQKQQINLIQQQQVKNNERQNSIIKVQQSQKELILQPEKINAQSQNQNRIQLNNKEHPKCNQKQQKQCNKNINADKIKRPSSQQNLSKQTKSLNDNNNQQQLDQLLEIQVKDKIQQHKQKQKSLQSQNELYSPISIKKSFSINNFNIHHQQYKLSNANNNIANNNNNSINNKTKLPLKKQQQLFNQNHINSIVNPLNNKISQLKVQVSQLSKQKNKLQVLFNKEKQLNCNLTEQIKRYKTQILLEIETLKKQNFILKKYQSIYTQSQEKLKKFTSQHLFFKNQVSLLKKQVKTFKQRTNQFEAQNHILKEQLNKHKKQEQSSIEIQKKKQNYHSSNSIINQLRNQIQRMYRQDQDKQQNYKTKFDNQQAQINRLNKKIDSLIIQNKVLFQKRQQAKKEEQKWKKVIVNSTNTHINEKSSSQQANHDKLNKQQNKIIQHFQCRKEITNLQFQLKNLQMLLKYKSGQKGHQTLGLQQIINKLTEDIGQRQLQIESLKLINKQLTKKINCRHFIQEQSS